MERASDFGGCEVEGALELLFCNGQHSFHPRGGAVLTRGFFDVFKNFSDELGILDRRGPHRTCKLRTRIQEKLSMIYQVRKAAYMKGGVALWASL